MVLSWGASRELIVGHRTLALYHTGPSPVCLWRKPLGNVVQRVCFSYDSSYIACVGYTDRLIKVWRRLNFGSDNVGFDFFYLRHPEPVTNLQWRAPYHVGHTIDHVLYTFCVDNILRIWTKADVHSTTQQQLFLRGEVDLAASLHFAALDNSAFAGEVQWAFIIPGRDLSAATERAVQERDETSEKNTGALQHLVDIANRSSEVCIVLDARGALAAISLENPDSKSPKTNDTYTITHLTSPDLDFSHSLGSPPTLHTNHVEIYTFCDNSKGHLHLLLHYFTGTIDIYEANVALFFNETSSGPRLWHKSTWSGHSGPIRKMVRNFSGGAVVSRTHNGEGTVWSHTHGNKGTPLSPNAVLMEEKPIRRICVLRKGRFVVFLFDSSLAVWDCRSGVPTLLGHCDYTISGKPLCLLVLPRERAQDGSVAHIATVTSENHGVVWEVVLPKPTTEIPPHQQNVEVKGQNLSSVSEYCRFDLGDAGKLAYMLPVDPAGANPIISGFLDVFARDVAISYTETGRIEFWTARLNHSSKRVEWLSTSSMETGIRSPSLVSGSTRKKAALVNDRRSVVTIWDIQGAQLEYESSFESHDTVQDLDWTSTPDSQSILAVGFPHRVLLLSQLRYDYLNKGPAWAVVRVIDIRGQTPHPIGDSTWLGDGDFVIGAGNQLLVHDRMYSIPNALVAGLRLPQSRTRNDLFDVVQRLNGPLPVFHPQFLSQCMLAGKNELVQQILMSLHNVLKLSVQGDAVDDYLGIELEQFYKGGQKTMSREKEKNSKASLITRDLSIDDDSDVFTESVAQAISEKLTTFPLPQLSGHEQIQLMDIVECAGLLEKQRRSMDGNGARYMLFFRQHALRKGRTNEIHIGWREFCWAFHSTSQDILVDFVSRQHHGSLVWEHARESGMFMWLTDNSAVKTQFEVIARNEYAKSELKNPVDCSLFYLALKKKAVLQGLWRMASWNREQGATQRLLSNNFEERKWKTTALKNAYALMSKRRFEYAAAFFLLADRLQDAMNVCFNQLQDLQLAVIIARVYEGDQGPVLMRFLEEVVLNVAAQEGNRWLASWAFWMLRRKDMSVRALITPVYTLIETPCSPDIKSKLFLTDDPALVVLYGQLRQKTLQTLRGVSKVTPRAEWELVLHSARLYGRMGCDLLGVDLVRNWEFLLAGPSSSMVQNDVRPLQMLRRRSSLVVADLPLSHIAEQLPADLNSDGAPKMAPSVFEEPDPNSLLDSFGF
ncbi:hypothetical protein HMPREF1624_08707 [Sporothrix schenckii ATCC 58251]|uniref:RAVE complex protein Rav1 C-terminal domain-containing protein n=1 Tax=Sporothrix schenckii (strain ATCC 58251 / de Perez 2211183) TaxID=1391915 RepID=U7PKE4_SPOS1|nr:hypothetical protein HMPREF1624_08707 [Sporothrix schenckii ATCC 58251]